MSHQQSPLGWGHPGSERSRQPPPGSTPVGATGFAPHEAAYLRRIEDDGVVAQYPAADKPFVGPIVGGIVTQIVGIIVGIVGLVLLRETHGWLAPVIVAGVIVTIGSLSVLVGLYRGLNAVQVIYLLLRRR